MEDKTSHSFIPGDQWLYFQIYGGQHTLDKILKTEIVSLVEHFNKEKLIDKWFFIRYSSPDHHLRIRFFLVDKESIGKVINEVNKALKYYFDSDLIWNVSINTYQRELQRYLFDKIGYSEELFSVNSEVVRLFLKEEKATNDSERILFCLWHLNTMLEFYSSKLDVKIDFIEEYYESYSKEFNQDYVLKKQINLKYNQYLNSIKLLFDVEGNELQKHFKDVEFLSLNGYESNFRLIRDEGRCEESSYKSVFKSHIHMFVNRLFMTQHRKYELFLYFFLLRYFKMQKGKMNAEVN